MTGKSDWYVVKYRNFGESRIFDEREAWQRHLSPNIQPEFMEWMNTTFGGKWYMFFTHKNIRTYGYMKGLGNRNGWIRVPECFCIILNSEADEIVYRLHWNKNG